MVRLILNILIVLSAVVLSATSIPWPYILMPILAFILSLVGINFIAPSTPQTSTVRSGETLRAKLDGIQDKFEADRKEGVDIDRVKSMFDRARK